MERPIAIVAGNGALPLELATHLTAIGQKIFICAIDGEASKGVEAFPHAYFRFGQIGKLFKSLKQNEVARVVLAGGVVGRPEMKISNMDLGGLLTLPKILSSMLGGDNEILDSVVRIFEQKGFVVVSVAELLPQLIATAGDNTETKTKTADLNMINEGVSVIAALAPHDVGQGCVVVGKRAIAIEGAEGTDAMLERVIQLREIGRLPKKMGGVLVKAMKRGQNEKVDLPTIGPKTVELTAAAQLNGIALEAGSTIIVERAAVMKIADEAKLFLYGFGD